MTQIPGVVHGFFERSGGISAAQFASLNCSFKVGDLPSFVVENRSRVLNAVGLGHAKLMVPNLVHGNEVLIVDDHCFIEQVSKTSADAVITTTSNVALGVTYADCLPILLASLDGSVVGAIHAGWRGICQEVIVMAVERMSTLCDRKSIVAAIGPALSQSGFTITGEVLSEFLYRWPEHVIGHGGSGNADLRLIAHAQLKRCGVDKIEHVGGFTEQNIKKYFSHRGEHGKTGRHLAVIAKTGTF